MRTLHIRCGSDIRDKLRAAGVAGDFLEVSDPVCQGPVPDGLDETALREARSSFLAGAYGLTLEAARRRLAAEAAGLDGAGTYDRLVLWFEHDSYDQTVLIRLLDRFAAEPERWLGRLFLICIDRHPGIERFIGLGQLDASQLAELAAGPEVRPVSKTQLALGRAAWSAFRAADPAELARVVSGETPELPLLAPALRRHLQELPWTRDGLSLAERLLLTAAAAEKSQIGRDLFRAYQKSEPLPFLGDTMIRPILLRLAGGAEPAVTWTGEWGDTVRITPAGRRLLEGDADWLLLHGGSIDRWVGGIHLAPPASWRWDETAGAPVAVTSAVPTPQQ
jgi:hypothetical protein